MASFSLNIVYMHAAGYAIDQRLDRSRSVEKMTRNGDTSFTAL